MVMDKQIMIDENYFGSKQDLINLIDGENITDFVFERIIGYDLRRRVKRSGLDSDEKISMLSMMVLALAIRIDLLDDRIDELQNKLEKKL